MNKSIHTFTDIMLYLKENEGTQMIQLYKETQRTRTNLHNMLKKLIKRGFVRKEVWNKTKIRKPFKNKSNFLYFLTFEGKNLQEYIEKVQKTLEDIMKY